MLKDKVILVTGGTGSFGNAFVKTVLANHSPRKIIIYSRDEFKQYEMAKRFADHQPKLRFFIGDVRDRDRLYRALGDVDIVVHAAALKQVPAAEYNPFEAVQTNIHGAQNVISACLDAHVPHVIAPSSDKACNPVNLYGATKLCSDKLFVAANAYAGPKQSRFAVVRYGNVLGSRGSIIPLFRELAAKGEEIPITDDRMTRFWITLPQAVNFVLMALARMQGGELFIPRIPSMRIMDLARAIDPNARTRIIGIRPGEKLHEMMISRDDSRNLWETQDYYIKLPEFCFWSMEPLQDAKPVPEGFEYASDTNDRWMNTDELRAMLQQEGL